MVFVDSVDVPTVLHVLYNRRQRVYYGTQKVVYNNRHILSCHIVQLQLGHLLVNELEHLIDRTSLAAQGH